MIQPITLLCVGLCFLVLYLRYRSQPQNRPRRTLKQKMKTAKILLVAFLAWMTVSFALQHQIGQMDGADHEPSMMERVVHFLLKLTE